MRVEWRSFQSMILSPFSSWLTWTMSMWSFVFRVTLDLPNNVFRVGPRSGWLCRYPGLYSHICICPTCSYVFSILREREAKTIEWTISSEQPILHATVWLSVCSSLDLLTFEDIRKNMVYLLKNDSNVDPESVERQAIEVTRDVCDVASFPCRCLTSWRRTQPEASPTTVEMGDDCQYSISLFRSFSESGHFVTPSLRSCSAEGRWTSRTPWGLECLLCETGVERLFNRD